MSPSERIYGASSLQEGTRSDDKIDDALIASELERGDGTDSAGVPCATTPPRWPRLAGGMSIAIGNGPVTVGLRLRANESSGSSGGSECRLRKVGCLLPLRG